MQYQRWIGVLLLIAFVFSIFNMTASAGMPALLPTKWTKDAPNGWQISTESSDLGSGDARLQAISFFVVVLLLCAWGVQWSWHHLRQDFPWLPVVSYRRSLSLVVLWGLLFVVVLTMISGARELMTPGAWVKQGWTYKLAQPSDSNGARVASIDNRRQALEGLRQSLWQYAATHEGLFPDANDPAVVSTLWDIPGYAGLKFMLVPNQTAVQEGHLLVFEPNMDGNERLVLLTNGFVGTMRSSEIQQFVATSKNADQ
jgi:hypothetical protein